MFGSAAKRLAHNSTIPALGLAANQDLRPLQELIAAEKAVIISLQRLSTDFTKASEALRAWGVGEGDDLGDILNSSTIILNQFGTALSQYASLGHTMREHLKAIRTREENLDDLRKRRRHVLSKAESAEKKLSRMSTEHKNLPAQIDLLNKLKDEIKMLDQEIMTEETSLGDFKRTTTKTWLGLKFGGLVECCEKGTIVGEYGRLLIGEIPEDITQPGMPRRMYYGHPHTQRFVSEANRCIGEVVLSSASPQGNRPSQPDDSAYAPPPPPPGAAPSTPPLSPTSTGGRPSFGNMDQVPPPPDYLNNQPEQSTLLAPSPFSVPMPEPRPTPSSVGYSDSSQRQYNQDPSLSRPVDDFGVMSGSPSRPIDNSTSGGRFAAFPIKSRQNNDAIGSNTGSFGPGGPDSRYSYGYNRDQPPSLSSRQEIGPSFSSSIAEALSSDGINITSDFNNYQTQGRQGQDVYGNQGLRPGQDGAGVPRVPSPVSPPFPVPTVLPAAGPPPLPEKSNSLPQDLQNPWNEGSEPPRGPTLDHNNQDAMLAYMLSADDDDRRSETSSSKHVRFGEVSDIDHEMNERYERAARELREQEDREKAALGAVAPPEPQPQPAYARPQRVPPPKFLPDTKEPGSSQSPPPAGPAGPAPPSYSESHPSTGESGREWPRDEKSQNAAVAREIARELETRPYNAPPSPLPGASPVTPRASAWNQSPPPPSGPSDTGYEQSYPGTTGYSQYQHPPSPLRDRRSMSDVQYDVATPTAATGGSKQSLDAPAQHLQPPHSPGSPSFVTPAQAYAQAHSPYLSNSPSISTSSFQGRYDPPGHGPAGTGASEGGGSGHSRRPSSATGSRYDQGISPPAPATGAGAGASADAGPSPRSPGFGNTAKLNSPLPPPPFEEPQPTTRDEARERRGSFTLPPLSPIYSPASLTSSPTAPKPPELASREPSSGGARGGSLGFPAFNRSNTSLNSPGGVSIPGPGGSPGIGGQKTISAAAFKRPSPRLGTFDVGAGGGSGQDVGAGAGGGVGTGGTSPLSVKKKSPTVDTYARRMEGVGAGAQQGGGPGPGGRPVSFRGEDDQYDYLNAYVDDSSAGGASQGYGSGRFATDLEAENANGGGLR